MARDDLFDSLGACLQLGTPSLDAFLSCTTSVYRMAAGEIIMHTSSDNSTRILRLQNVKSRTGLSRSTIYALIKETRFPKNISLGARSVGWLESEIEAWIKDRVNDSRNKQ